MDIAKFTKCKHKALFKTNWSEINLDPRQQLFCGSLTIRYQICVISDFFYWPMKGLEIKSSYATNNLQNYAE